jgi:hypothetical protein
MEFADHFEVMKLLMPLQQQTAAASPLQQQTAMPKFIIRHR